MNKLFRKASVALAGLAMAVGVGFAVGGVKAPAETKAVVAGNIFRRISALNELTDGSEIIFVNQAGTYACGTTQNENNRTPVSITTDSNEYVYSSSDNVQVFTVKTNTINQQTKFGFHTGSGYIYSASSSKNYLRTNTTKASTAPADTSAWSLSIDEGTKVITATNVTNTSYYIAFNGTSYFTQYASGQTKPFIYKNTGESGISLSSMSVTTAPTKKTYTEGEVFDPAGMVVTGTYSDSSTAPIANNNITWANSGRLSAGQTTLSGTYQNVNVQVTGLTVNQLPVSSLQTVYQAAMDLGEGKSGNTYYRFAGIVTAIEGSSVYTQDVTGGYPLQIYSSNVAKDAAIGKKVTVVSTIKNYYLSAETNSILSYAISENDGEAVEPLVINNFASYGSARMGMLVSLKGLGVLKAISATTGTALTSIDSLAYGEDAISFYVAKEKMTEDMASLLTNYKVGDNVDLNNVIRFKNSGRNGVDFIGLTTVSGGTPATSITINSETSINLPLHQTSQIDAELDALATDQRITYSSSDENVATVSDSGLISAVAAGSATITVASLSTPSVNATISVTVTSRQWVQNAYNKVYLQSELEAGAKYIIVYESSATSGYSSNCNDVNNGAAAVSINDGVIVPNAQIDEGAITITSMNTGYSLQINSSHSGHGDKYLGGESGNNTVVYSDDALENSIVITDGVALITNNTSFIQYNSNKRFRYYKSGTTSQSDVSLYKYIGGTISTDQYAAYFSGSTTDICSATSTSADHSESLERFWAYLGAKFESLSESDRSLLSNMEGQAGGTPLQDAIARYDHILIRYGTGTLSDFMNRTGSGRLVLGAKGTSSYALGSNVNGALPAIIALSLSGIVAGGLFFALRKRKER